MLAVRLPPYQPIWGQIGHDFHVRGDIKLQIRVELINKLISLV